MSEKITVLVKRVGQPPSIEEIGNDFHTMRDIVGGAIGMTLIEEIPRATITYNDTGLLDNLPPNITWGDGFIAGNIVIAGNQYGETVSLTEEQLNKAIDFIIQNDIKQYDTLGELLEDLFDQTLPGDKPNKPTGGKSGMEM